MKKFLFIAMAAVAVTFTSCKNDPAPQPTPGEGEEVETVELVPADSLKSFIEAADTAKISNFLTEAKTKIEELTKTDPAKAKEYLAAIQGLLKENADKIKAFVGTGIVANLVDEVSKLPEITVPDVVEDAKDAVENAAEGAKDVVEGAKDKVEGAVEDVKEAAGDAAQKVEDKAAEVKDKAAEKVAEGADKAADAIKGAVGK
ncbi:MAG: hypothetical protein J5548_00040 [Prevotella sp.]|nr:hypothetical protein [Prevotella sp.]